MHDRSGRRRAAAFLAEGEDLVLAAVHAGASLQYVLVDADRDLVDEIARGLDRTVDIVRIQHRLMADVTTLGHPPRVLAVVDVPAEATDAVVPTSAPWVFLDAVSDPGNVGTVVRSAAAFGARGVLLGEGCADPWSPKAVRASMGACFIVDIRSDARVPDGRLVALDASGTVVIADADLGSADVLVVGAERRGVSASTLRSCDVVARIDHRPTTESLNAGVAASIALYEAVRPAATGSARA